MKDGGHNSKRPDEVIDKIMNLIQKHSEERDIIDTTIEKDDIKIVS